MKRFLPFIAALVATSAFAQAPAPLVVPEDANTTPTAQTTMPAIESASSFSSNSR